MHLALYDCRKYLCCWCSLCVSWCVELYHIDLKVSKDEAKQREELEDLEEKQDQTESKVIIYPKFWFLLELLGFHVLHH